MRRKTILTIAMAALVLAGCEGAFEGVCPVTEPNGMTPPGEQPSELHHGIGELYTALWPDGTIPFSADGPGTIREDGSFSMKFPWWRGEGVSGPLTIRGRDISGGLGELGSEIPEGYGDTGFQASGLIFPEEGCWEITARAAEAELTVIVEVVRTDR
jgi:hypothetical protein